MNNLRIVYDNAISRATVTASSEATNRQATNLQSDRKSSVWRSAGTTPLSQRIRATWPSAEKIAGVFAVPSNLSPAATMRVRTTLESPRVNFMRYSEQLDIATTWVPTNLSAVAVNSALAPDGTMTASKVVDAAAGGTSVGHFLAQSVSGAVTTAGQTFCVSVFIKAAEIPFFCMRFDAATTAMDGAVSNVYVNTATGAKSGEVTNGYVYAVQALPNGWFRVRATAVSTAAGVVAPRFMLATSSGSFSYVADVPKGLLMWGAQLELGNQSSYYPSKETFVSRSSSATYVGSNGLLQTASLNTARMQYNPNDLSAPAKLLLEGAATNLLLYAEQFDQTAWNKVGRATPANASDVTGPNGNIGSFKFISAAADAYLGQTATLAATTAYTFSVWAKCATGTQNTALYFASASAAVTLTPTWQRVAVTATTTTAGSYSVQIGGGSTLGVGVEIHLWGAQLETGVYPTSYIPTTTAAASRAADVSTSATATRPRGYIDTWQSYQSDTGPVFCCRAPAVPLRGWTDAQAANAFSNGGGVYARVWMPRTDVYGIAIEIEDPGNLQGYLEIATLVAGDYWSPQFNASSTSFSLIDTTELYRTDAGDQVADAGTLHRKLTIDQSAMTAADRAAYAAMTRNSRAYPVLLSVFPESTDPALERDYTVYGRRTKNAEIALAFAGAYTANDEIEEI